MITVSLVCVGNVLLSQAVTRQVSSTLRSLTSVFGMGTGGPSLPASPTHIFLCAYCTLKTEQLQVSDYHFILSIQNLFWSSPRPISTAQLNMLPCLHPLPIYHIVFVGSYLLIAMGNLILKEASRLDAFSVYPFRT